MNKLKLKPFDYFLGPYLNTNIKTNEKLTSRKTEE